MTHIKIKSRDLWQYMAGCDDDVIKECVKNCHAKTRYNFNVDLVIIGGEYDYFVSCNKIIKYVCPSIKEPTNILYEICNYAYERGEIDFEVIREYPIIDMTRRCNKCD